ncbi:hypothetical protein AB0M46_24140 [Dactylosporangium sp. NPDC051485]|uniref:hypothetical protein n=1 Tax=Dactylosporangium sp. NPDC051485 TaxID=3154846 RepID=UPI0034491892
MGQGRGAGKRGRRQPGRRPIPVPGQQVDRIRVRASADRLLLPGLGLDRLTTEPVELTPLFAMLIAVHQAVGDLPPDRVVVESAQMVHALRQLGFEAELIACCARVFRLPQHARLADMGVWKRPPTTRADGTTDGHALVWIGSFNRLVDVGVFRSRRLLRAEGGADETFTVPAMLPLPHGRSQLLNPWQIPGTIRGQFSVGWYPYPEWTQRYRDLLTCHAAVIEHGGVALAHTVVDLLNATRTYRDLSRVDELFPRLAALMSATPEALLLPEQGGMLRSGG